MKIRTYISIATAAILLTACGGGTSSGSNTTNEAETKTVSGIAIDGYLDGAIVSIGGKTTTTDSQGRWSITYSPSDDIKEIVSIFGGEDTATGESFEGVLKAPIGEEDEEIYVTPLSTLTTSLVEKGLTKEEAEEKMVTQLGIPKNILKSDPIATLKTGDETDKEDAATAFKKALVIQKTAETIAQSVALNSDITTMNQIMDQVMDQVANSMNNGKSFDDIMDDTEAIINNIITNNTNSISIENLSEKLEAVKEVAQSVSNSIDSIDLEYLISDGVDVDSVIESKSKAIEIITEAIEKKVEAIAESKNTEEIKTAKDNAKNITKSIAMLGGVNGIEYKVEEEIFNTGEVNASDFSSNLLESTILESAQIQFDVLNDANLSTEMIQQIGEESSSIGGYASEDSIGIIIDDVVALAVINGDISEGEVNTTTLSSVYQDIVLLTDNISATVSSNKKPPKDKTEDTESIESTNHLPIANAGENQDVNTSSLVTLDGSKSSDEDGDTLTYYWDIVSEPNNSNISLSNNNEVQPKFTPQLDGNYTFSLSLSDGIKSITTIDLSNVEEINNGYVVKAFNYKEETSTISTITGTNHDGFGVLGDASGAPEELGFKNGKTEELIVNFDQNLTSIDVSFAWMNRKEKAKIYFYQNGKLLENQIHKYGTDRVDPPINFSLSSGAQFDEVRFTALGNGDDFLIHSISYNSAEIIKSDIDTVTITATTQEIPNTAPIANAGVDKNITIGTSILLDGSKSSDIDGDTLTYDWTILSQPIGSNIVLSDTSIVNPAFTPVTPGEYSFSLVVNDGKIDSNNTDNVKINMEPTSQTTSENSTYLIVDTAQTKCYNSSTGVEITCNDVGYDSDYSGNQPSYTKNNTGTIVTDNITGLMWTQSSDIDGDGVTTDADDKKSYDESVIYCSNLTLEGYEDWRLPDIKTLYSLMQFKGEDPSGYEGTDTNSLVTFLDDSFTKAFGDISADERIIDGQYATATKYVSTTMNGDETMFGVNFVDGRIKGYPLTMMNNDKLYYILCTRGDENYGKNNFIDNNDSTITDNATELMWQKDDTHSLNFDDAVNSCQSDTTGNYTDWRLPNIKELQSIVDYSRSPDTTASAAINPIFNTTSFINEEGEEDWGYYWSSTTHASIDNGKAGAYISFGRALGNMNTAILDVHGAGAQRSNNKIDISTDPIVESATDTNNDTYYYKGPQGDILRLDNMVRCVRDKSAAIANAGEDENTTMSYPLTLDGSNSIGVNNNQVTYAWSIIEKPTGDYSFSLTNETTSTPIFESEASGEYIIELVINDGKYNSETDRIKIIVTNIVDFE